ncbi:pimeloyl-ACP methyl ester carboxylesterase [Microbacterium resistens]|uniref:Pimeloyl-ACP methyl ester carboxylesterase n=1 Tax=Microbacterium resistens TaxID=156977 RepID=A0ABU1S8Z0_9MICO|nr:alpha/beta hydrolase [Microbacterium resistens]MDR6866083.1 pimeloyl-ACP methyl ester carboxylesterase [Microbacterium resistens]
MTEDTTAPAVITRTVGEGDDAITYDVRGDLAAATPDRPALFLFGAPMDASGFEILAGHFTDRPVVTYDPRGAGRNPVGTSPISAEQHADDLHRVIAALDAGPVDAFGSSGGGVSLLALLAAHPGEVRHAVVHEPATAALLPDRDRVLAVVDDMKRTYAEKGQGPALAAFIQFVMLDGPVPDGYLDGPAPDPAMFGLPTEDDGSRTDPLFRNMPGILAYAPDVDALRALGGRLSIAAGVESGDTMPARAARAVAAAVGIPATEFPSNHGGFTEQPGYPSDPAGIAHRLRELLSD